MIIMSFREKSLWVSILISLIIASMYGDNIYAIFFSSVEVSSKQTVNLINRIVIAFIILEIVLHIALAMDDQEGASGKEDERERRYRLLANNSGYWLLSIGLILCVVLQMATVQFSFEQTEVSQRFILAPIELKLVVVFWLSEVARFSHEIYLYRKED